jgi:hypothetical protein
MIFMLDATATCDSCMRQPHATAACDSCIRHRIKDRINPIFWSVSNLAVASDTENHSSCKQTFNAYTHCYVSTKTLNSGSCSWGGCDVHSAQGDQIGRIFVYCVIYNFRLFLKVTQVAINGWLLFIFGKSRVLISTKNRFGYTLGDFLKKHLVTLTFIPTLGRRSKDFRFGRRLSCSGLFTRNSIFLTYGTRNWILQDCQVEVKNCLPNEYSHIYLAMPAKLEKVLILLYDTP